MTGLTPLPAPEEETRRSRRRAREDAADASPLERPDASRDAPSKPAESARERYQPRTEIPHESGVTTGTPRPVRDADLTADTRWQARRRGSFVTVIALAVATSVLALAGLVVLLAVG